MAKQVIGIGTVANDGTGDALRDAFDKANDNFTELYGTTPPDVLKLYKTPGFGFYVHDQSTPSTQVITTTSSKLIIDGAGSTSTSAYLPYDIRGSAELWDTVNNKILPIDVGDGYTLRIDLNITAKSGAPAELVLELDIAGGATPTTVIVERIIGTSKTPPYTVSVGFPFFSLATFIANGGQIFLKTDAGTVTVTNRQISIHRISHGQLW